jgi:hypothetical protein
MVVDAAKGSDEVYMWYSYVALLKIGDDREHDLKRLYTWGSGRDRYTRSTDDQMMEQVQRMT